MKKNKGFIFLTIIVLAIIVSLYFDRELIKLISLARTGVIDSFFLAVTAISSEAIIFLVLTSLFVFNSRKREWIFPLWISIGISALISFILKVSIQRLRPFQAGIISIIPSLIEKSHSIWNYSFPSSHSMIAFCAVPILSMQFPKLKKLWIAFAVLIAISRVYLGLHFVSDVLAGGLIGYLIGAFIAKEEKENHLGRQVYNKIFKK
jgi:undecaprenyl-diphosphatase